MEERWAHEAKEFLSSMQLKPQGPYLERLGCLRTSGVAVGYTSCLIGVQEG